MAMTYVVSPSQGLLGRFSALLRRHVEICTKHTQVTCAGGRESMEANSISDGQI